MATRSNSPLLTHYAAVYGGIKVLGRCPQIWQPDTLRQSLQRCLLARGHPELSDTPDGHKYLRDVRPLHPGGNHE